MPEMNRRKFMQLTVSSYVLSQVGISAGPGRPARVSKTGTTLRAEGANYAWEWSQETDRFRLLDSEGRVVTSGILQPAVIVQPGSDKQARKCTSGKDASAETGDGAVTVTYADVNGHGKVSVTWRFEEGAFWLEPIVYESAGEENVVALHYFAEGSGDAAKPTLENFYLILPGIAESSGIGPIVTSDMGLTLTSWLGRGSSPSPGLLQQWGLPAHFFCGFHRNRPGATRSSMTKHVSEAFCCGLAELPNGDFFIETNRGRHSPIMSYRSDIWNHLRGPGKLSLGARFYWTVAPNYREAIRRYYLGLVQAGVIRKKANSAKKNAAALSPQFNTWGAQVAIEKHGPRLDQVSLESFYSGMKVAGMKAGMFVVDDKWEGVYGNLRHDDKRLPHWEQFIKKVRTDGHHFGVWAAFMRCEDPSDLGLDVSHMLHLADGKPHIVGWGDQKYYILDFTQPKVEEVLRAQAKRFVQRYNPDLVKFDFGYELPPLSVAAPKDMNLAGERLMMKGLQVIVGAMREVNPDLVVMYYSLSPLFSEYFDLHSPDDLFMAAYEYDYDANRRFFFSSLLGEIGIPTYGSGGYDWETVPEIWFDSALIGTLGSLNSFEGDEQDNAPTPQLIAKYNGLTHVLRPTNTFTIEAVDADYLGPARGARSASWARLEGGKLVGAALRAHGLDGRQGSRKFGEVVETTASVVVASKTSDELSRASKLAVVPYGEGELRLRRADRGTGHAEATVHSFGGKTEVSRIEIRDGLLRVPLRERGEKNGAPVEWIEVSIRA
jgi:hypothetical protein